MKGKPRMVAAADFYRDFYRTARNPVEVSSMVQHTAPRNRRSVSLPRADYHPSDGAGSEFKSPLAHRWLPGVLGPTRAPIVKDAGAVSTGLLTR